MLHFSDQLGRKVNNFLQLQTFIKDHMIFYKCFIA